MTMMTAYQITPHASKFLQVIRETPTTTNKIGCYTYISSGWRYIYLPVSVLTYVSRDGCVSSHITNKSEPISSNRVLKRCLVISNLFICCVAVGSSFSYTNACLRHSDRFSPVPHDSIIEWIVTTTDIALEFEC
jgi:hypothetical protein